MIDLPISADKCVEAMLPKGFAAGIPIGRYYNYTGADKALLVAATEKRTREEIDAFVNDLQEAVG